MRLTDEERDELWPIIARLDVFIDEDVRGRRVLLQNAHLERFLGMKLSGDTDIVAQDLVNKLETYGYLLPERPTYHALGALLNALLRRPDLPQDQATFLATLIVRYSLILDPRYIDALRAKYGIAETSPPPPTMMTPFIPPPALPVSTQQPIFNVQQVNVSGLESIINSANNFLDIYLLFGAAYSALAVCRIEDSAGKAMGTGVLIGPDLLLTCQHVLKKKEYLSGTIARFDYRVDASKVAQPGRKISILPDTYFSSEALDYAVVRLAEAPLKHMTFSADDVKLSYLECVLAGKHRGYLVLAKDFIKEHDRVNIIQHPNGDPMKVVLTQNYVVADINETTHRVQYLADTMEGSSGSPVFNQNWEIVALHHSGKPIPPDSIISTLQRSVKGHFKVNEGIPVRSLWKDFDANGLANLMPTY